MSKHADIIIRVGETFVAVLDARTSHHWIMDRGEELDTAGAVSAALGRLHVKKPATAVVLSSDFFTQKVRLGVAQARGLSHGDLLSALAFEVEPFSNIPRDQGVLECGPGGRVGDFMTWDVMHVSKSEITKISTALRSTGIKLGWTGCADDDFPVGDDAAAKAALMKCLVEIGNESQSFPLLSAAPSGGMEIGGARPGAIAVVLVCVVCLCHDAVMDRVRSSLRDASAKLDVVASEIEGLGTGIRNCKTQVQAIEETRARRDAAERRLELHRTALSVFFDALPAACGDEVFIQSITPVNPFELRIGAFSSDEDGPYNCMERLAGAIRDCGWTVFPEQASNVNSTGDRGSARFVFRADFAAGHATVEKPEGPEEF